MVTHHARERISKRIGVGKSNAESVAKKALERGLTHSDAKGRLKKYMDGLFLSHRTANNMRIYSQKVFLFRNDILITVLPLPTNLKKIVADIARSQQPTA